MNKIQLAMRNKVNEALGEIEYQLDIFMDNGYKSNFKMEKYLSQIKFKKKLVVMMRESWDGSLAEVCSDDPDYLEGYAFMTKPEKKKYIKFLENLKAGCDKYIEDNQAEWTASNKAARARNKSKRRSNARLKEIESSSGYGALEKSRGG
jgi:hypothetical protein